MDFVAVMMLIVIMFFLFVLLLSNLLMLLFAYLEDLFKKKGCDKNDSNNINFNDNK